MLFLSYFKYVIKKIRDLKILYHNLKNENKEPSGPLRVWIDLGYKLGLCMTRSIGDNDAKPHGILCEPGIKFYLVIKIFEKN
jgi:hypothetical protein